MWPVCSFSDDLQAQCSTHRETVTGTKRLFMPISQSHLKRFNALAEMLSDTPAADNICKATVDAMVII